jgi:hypothetical protein
MQRTVFAVISLVGFLLPTSAVAQSIGPDGRANQTYSGDSTPSPTTPPSSAPVLPPLPPKPRPAASAVATTAAPLAASTPPPPRVATAAVARLNNGQLKLYVEASPSFTTALTAALIKKNDPIVIVEDKGRADFILESAAVDSKEESTGGKIARCLFLDCIGINGNSEVSVKLVRLTDSAVVWAYQVRKANAGPLGVQSLSEAIAKHLKNDFLKKYDK